MLQQVAAADLLGLGVVPFELVSLGQQSEPRMSQRVAFAEVVQEQRASRIGLQQPRMGLKLRGENER